MKLRIDGNSVRLRLSKSEVEKAVKGTELEEWTSFGNGTLVYALQSTSEGNELSANFDGTKITMFVPEALLKDWAINDVIGFEAHMQVSGAQDLHLLVEKDFKCLDNSTEDQSDNYENPKK